jgi:tetratricopeptide (TPR) repeat protein
MPARPPGVARPASVGRRRLIRWLGIAGVVLGLALVALVLGRSHLRAWYHRRAARAELQRYHTPQAIRHLRICRDVWPRDPEVLLLAARAARRARVYGDSERLLEMYRQIRGPDDAFAFELLLLAAECRVDRAADQCWQRLDQGRGDAPLLLEALTRGYLRQYRLDQARRCLERWRQVRPDDPQAWYLEGLLLFDYLHARAAALNSYRRAVELDPDHEEARLGLAVALLEDKSFAPAAEQFARLRQSQPENARLQVGLAECLDGLGETAEAARLVDDVLARQSHFAPALSLRGQWALREGHLAEAERDLRAALRRQPMDHRARYRLVSCLQRGEREEEARREQEQLAQIEEDVARFNAIVTKELVQRPSDPALHCAVGQLLLRGGQRDEGLRWLQSALRLDAQYAPAQQALADYLRQSKAESRPGPP